MDVTKAWLGDGQMGGCMGGCVDGRVDVQRVMSGCTDEYMDGRTDGRTTDIPLLYMNPGVFAPQATTCCTRRGQRSPTRTGRTSAWSHMSTPSP